jgi:hypothetical protein
MASFWEKIEKFFAEPVDEAFLAGEPLEYEGKTFVPYRKEEDQYSQWPNATCPICGGLNLKKRLYYSKESETYAHKECLLKK